MNNYNFDYSGITNQSNDFISKFAIALGGFLIIACLIILAILIVYIVAKCTFYKKAGRKGWEAIIPFYSTWVLVEMSGLNWWWFLILMASSIVSLLFGDNNDNLIAIAYLATIFGSFVCHYNLSKKLHKDTGFAILWTIFPMIMYPIIAFSKNYIFDKDVNVSKNGIFK